jgi:hypothetical protein
VPRSGYSVAETIPAGWDQTAASCDDGSPLANIDVAPGETVTCTFINTKRAVIVVRKTTVPAGSSDAFAFTPSYGATFTLKHGESNSSAPLLPRGGYSVAETVPAGWDQTGATCSDGSPLTNIDLAPGEIVTCTFTNTKRGTIVVRKVTAPVDSTQSFDFTTSYGAPFTLKNGASNTSAPLVPRVGYTVRETVPTGWTQTGAACSDGSPVGNIDLGPGETVTCTFTNTVSFPGDGFFVIGDLNSALGTAVTFWGSQWRKLNSLSSSPAPSDFKGFAKRPGGPGCGQSWNTDPGNSPPPPAPPLPAYIGVIVSSSITKVPPLLVGNTPHIVIVRTNPGYSSNPGHAGTGTVVAVVC